MRNRTSPRSIPRQGQRSAGRSDDASPRGGSLPANAAGRASRVPVEKNKHSYLYIEGPGDRGILRAWSYRLLPAQGPALLRGSVILGGRRPERAIGHFSLANAEAGGARGLCVLDRDDEHAWAAPNIPGLEFFTWSRRHIESYLLVSNALLRAIDAGPDAPRFERALREHLPLAADEPAHRVLDAKRLLSPKGPLSRALGRPLPLARIARATREEELHADVLRLFERLRALIE